MQDKSVVVPVVYLAFLTMVLLFSVPSSPVHKLIEGSVATTTVEALEPTVAVENELATTTELDSIEEVVLLEVATNTSATTTPAEPVVMTEVVSTTTTPEEVVVDIAPTDLEKSTTTERLPVIESSIEEVTSEESTVTLDDIVLENFYQHIIPEKGDFLDFRKCQSDRRSSRYKNAGECIRDMRE